LSQLATRYLTADGVLAVEIGGTYQEKDVLSVLRENGLENFEVIKDYLGQSRGILARLNK
jgi:methylase of polypeptide subunit release factors